MDDPNLTGGRQCGRFRQPHGESDAFSKDLKRRGFTFVGSTIIYVHMQAIGMVNDHLVDCFRYRELRRLGSVRDGPRILAGIVNVNSPTLNDEIHAPMGGVRDSGWGRTEPRSLDDFSDLIWINSHSGQRRYPF
jgi:hypothetical protein